MTFAFAHRSFSGPPPSPHRSRVAAERKLFLWNEIIFHKNGKKLQAKAISPTHSPLRPGESPLKIHLKLFLFLVSPLFIMENL